MTEHYCNEHNIAFVKHTKGDKVWYSHKLGSEWCNEPKEEAREYEETTTKEIIPEKPTPKPQPKPLTTDGKNKSYALSYAKDIACAMIKSGKEMSTVKVIDVAKLFEDYLEGKGVQPAKSRLVEEARRLGGVDIKEDSQ